MRKKINIIAFIVFFLVALTSLSQRDLEKSKEHFDNGMKIKQNLNIPEINNKVLEEFTLSIQYDTLCYKCYFVRGAIYEYLENSVHF